MAEDVKKTPGRPWKCPTCGAEYFLIVASSTITTWPADKATEAQIKAIFSIIGKDKYLESQARALMREKWNIESSQDLTKKQASELIDTLKATESSF